MFAKYLVLSEVAIDDFLQIARKLTHYVTTAEPTPSLKEETISTIRPRETSMNFFELTLATIISGKYAGKREEIFYGRVVLHARRTNISSSAAPHLRDPIPTHSIMVSSPGPGRNTEWDTHGAAQPNQR